MQVSFLQEATHSSHENSYRSPAQRGKGAERVPFPGPQSPGWCLPTPCSQHRDPGTTQGDQHRANEISSGLSVSREDNPLRRGLRTEDSSNHSTQPGRTPGLLLGPAGPGSSPPRCSDLWLLGQVCPTDCWREPRYRPWRQVLPPTCPGGCFFGDPREAELFFLGSFCKRPNLPPSTTNHR